MDTVLSKTGATVPARFESLLAQGPYAPAVLLYRSNGRVRRWTRAAVEHRAMRVGTLCAAYGLGAVARVAVDVTHQLDAMAAAFYALATGRILTTPDAAEFVIDDTLMSQPYGLDPEYVLRVLVCSDDPATWVDRPLHQGGLASLIERDAPSGLGPTLDEALGTLWHGAPIRIYEGLARESAA